MYEQYWQLSKAPFDCTSDPDFYFPARSHHGAVLKLRYVIEGRKGIALLVGEHGLGKSYLASILEHELSRHQYPLVPLIFPQLTPQEMLAYLAEQLSRLAEATDLKAEHQLALTRFETSLAKLNQQQREPVLMLDDAHCLSAEHLQTLQLLSNLQQKHRFSLLLIGRTELLATVRRVPALQERVAARTTLMPLSLDETRHYIAHRLQVAGLLKPVMCKQTMESIWERSRGIPRRINLLADLSLLVGYADQLSSLTPVEVEAAAEELLSVSAD